MQLELPLVYAVILNWNRPQDTINCLRSLAVQSHPNLKMLVVDNGSSDDSVARIQAACPDVKVLANPTNQGFARGMNKGLRQALAAGADFILTLNNDTLVAPDAVSRLLDHADSTVGLLAPIIYYAADPQRVWSLGGQIHPWTLEVIGSMRGRVDYGQWPDVLTCDFVPGCAMLLARETLEKAGLFDERFFMYYEDSDLCLRIRRAGFRILSVTTAKVQHQVALSSGGGDSVNERYWMARSSILFFAKHARWQQVPIIVIWRLASAARTTWRLLRARKPAVLKAYWQGLWHGLRELRQ